MSTKAKHTPGEWEASAQDRVLSGPHREKYATWVVTAARYDDDEEGGSIATVWSDSFGPQTEANATLIAAAPDLAEALAKALRWMDTFTGGPDAPTREVLQEARAALRKAGLL